ncbi:hypothetical protein FSP39_013945 [Pinctada imbricata]|uniref:Cation efflux protein transmembrane domain-containing protein n=1 Tax=Pinctada imbricata TaxID=66713 RepID=A0AA88YE69_PINIB|nr:hypothetical protein FSP39_013945 [Pinctada imbricata]
MTHVLLRQRGPFLSRRHLYQTLKNLTTKGTPPGSDGGGVNIIKCHVARHHPSRIYCRLYCTSSGSNDDTRSTQNRNNDTKSKQSGQSDINSTQSATSEPGSRSLSSEGHSEVEDPPSVLQNELKIVQNEKDVLVLQNKRLFEELQILKQLIEQANLNVPVPSGSSKSSDTSTAKAADAVVAKLAKDVQKKKRRTYDSKGNTEIELYRVMNDYLLTQKDLEKVPRKKSRSSVSHQSEEFLFRVTDVEKRAIEKWGSLEKMEKEKRRRERYRATGIGSSSPFSPRDQPFLIFMGDPNKKIAMLLLYGQYWSKKKADDTHPYGFGIAKNVTALISGVFIFGVGAGGSLYHALIDYLHPEPPVDMYWVSGCDSPDQWWASGSLYHAFIDYLHYEPPVDIVMGQNTPKRQQKSDKDRI